MSNQYTLRIIPNKNSSVFVVGDIHGEKSKLMLELYKQGFNFENDLCIAVGDLINKGSDSFSTLKLINEPWFRTVLGNNELVAINYFESSCVWAGPDWMNRGGDWFFSLNDEDKIIAKDLIVNQLKFLPYAIEVEISGVKYGITHADYPLDTWDLDNFRDDQIREQSVYSRELTALVKSGNSSDIKPVCGLKAIYHGHTIFKNITKIQNRHWIDTGAFKGGNLTCIELI